MAAPTFQNETVASRYAEYPGTMRECLLALRSLILDVAAETEGVGQLEETLKWNEPAYLTPKTKSGTTIRINAHKGSDSEYALYVHCQTDLVDRYRQLYADELRFEGNRAVIFSRDEELPLDAVKHCIAMALTYHLRP